MGIFSFIFFIVLKPIDLILQTIALALDFLKFVDRVFMLGLDISNFRHQFRIFIPFPSQLSLGFNCFFVVIFILSFELVELVFDSIAWFMDWLIFSLVGLDFRFDILDVFVFLPDFSDHWAELFGSYFAF